MKKNISITYNKYESSVKAAQKLRELLEKDGYTVNFQKNGKEELIVAIGGDGAFIKALQEYNFPSTPVVGINTGHLGFFQDILPSQLEEFIENYRLENFSIQQIVPIKAEIYTDEKIIQKKAANEFVIKSSVGKAIRLNVKINDAFIECFCGDGLIISSAVGSTAYNYSAGGAIIDPSVQAMQITPLAPISTNAYRSFTSGIICSSKSTISISPNPEYFNLATVIIDGETFNTGSISNISITASKSPINLIRMKTYGFWSKVTDKFL